MKVLILLVLVSLALGGPIRDYDEEYEPHEMGEFSFNLLKFFYSISCMISGEVEYGVETNENLPRSCSSFASAVADDAP